MDGVVTTVDAPEQENLEANDNRISEGINGSVGPIVSIWRPYKNVSIGDKLGHCLPFYKLSLLSLCKTKKEKK